MTEAKPAARHTTSLPRDYFDSLYAHDPDPWRFATSGYERDKYAATLAALPRIHYGRALEVGCSIGVLTRQVALRCQSLLALDIAVAALESARRQCQDLRHVSFQQASVPNDWPEGSFDLILFSEVLYYLDRRDLERLAVRVNGSCSTGGDIVLVHWTGETDYPLSGDDAVRAFMSASGRFDCILHQRESAYRLDILRTR